MKLQTLLIQNLSQLKPQALILIQHQGQYSVQKVYSQPQVLNLGVVLLGYYALSEQVQALSQLGDCLSIGHYVKFPRTLKYGRNFANNSKFQKLPAKLQKHLTGEIQDCCISFYRDLGIKRSSLVITKPMVWLKNHSNAKYVYVYQNHVWKFIKTDGRTLSKPVNLRDCVSSLLTKKV